MKHSIWIPQLIAILLLLWALYPGNPYGYYNLLRVICCALCIYLCVQAVILKQRIWPWILGTIAFIYNPLMPLKMGRPIWSGVNILTIILLGISVYFLKKETQR